MVVVALLVLSVMLWIGLAFFWLMPDMLDFIIMHYDLSDMLLTSIIGMLTLWIFFSKNHHYEISENPPPSHPSDNFHHLAK